MKSDEIMQTIKALGQVKGFYRNLLNNITEEDLNYLEQQCFEDEVELIIFLEEIFR